MLDLDIVESQFRASVKVRPELTPPDIRSVLLVTDLEAQAAARFTGDVRAFLKTIDGEDVLWTTLARSDGRGVQALLARIEQDAPSLVVTYRHLFEESHELLHSLGTYIEMLTQNAPVPLMLVPHPDREGREEALENTDRLMVVTDHIVGDNRLVSWALRLVHDDGQLRLAHIEDDLVYRRYMEVIGRISGIDTDYAEKKIKYQLLHEAEDYLEAVAQGARKTMPGLEVVRHIEMGHAITDYKRIVNAEEIDLLVFNSKDEGQVAMHGMAHALAIELIGQPILML